LRAGAFPPHERPDLFSFLTSPDCPSRGNQTANTVFRTSLLKTRRLTELIPAALCRIQDVHDTLSPGFISSIFDESGLQRTVSGTLHSSSADTKNSSTQ